MLLQKPAGWVFFRREEGKEGVSTNCACKSAAANLIDIESIAPFRRFGLSTKGKELFGIYTNSRVLAGLRHQNTRSLHIKREKSFIILDSNSHLPSNLLGINWQKNCSTAYYWCTVTELPGRSYFRREEGGGRRLFGLLVSPPQHT